jgi:hypothetical protein
MTSEEHHREAEYLLNHWSKNRNDIGRAQQFMPWLAAAQVHATLALAAATMANLERQQQAPHAVSQPSPSAGADRPGVVEKESTRIMREFVLRKNPESNREPDDAPTELPDSFDIEIITDQPDTPDQPPPGPA